MSVDLADVKSVTFCSESAAEVGEGLSFGGDQGSVWGEQLGLSVDEKSLRPIGPREWLVLSVL